MKNKSKTKIDPRLKGQLKTAIANRVKASTDFANSLDDPDSIEAVQLIKNITKTQNKLDEIIKSL